MAAMLDTDYQEKKRNTKQQNRSQTCRLILYHVECKGCGLKNVVSDYHALELLLQLQLQGFSQSLRLKRCLYTTFLACTVEERLAEANFASKFGTQFWGLEMYLILQVAVTELWAALAFC